MKTGHPIQEQEHQAVATAIATTMVTATAMETAIAMVISTDQIGTDHHHQIALHTEEETRDPPPLVARMSYFQVGTILIGTLREDQLQLQVQVLGNLLRIVVKDKIGAIEIEIGKIETGIEIGIEIEIETETERVLIVMINQILDHGKVKVFLILQAVELRAHKTIRVVSAVQLRTII